MTTINVKTYPNQPFVLPGIIPLFVGEDSIIGTWDFKLYKINFKTGEFKYSNDIANILSGCVAGAYVQPSVVRGGNLALTVLYTKSAEAQGSRYLYARRFVINPTDLTVVRYGSEVQFSNNVIDLNVLQGPPPIELAPNTLLFGHNKKANFIVADFWTRSIYTMPEYAPTGYFMHPFGIVKDRTNNNLALLAGKHYWITGSYSYIYAINPRDWSQIAASTAYDSGNGGMLQRSMYKDTADRVRMILFGGTGGYPYTSYTSKWNAIYVDNNSIVSEFTVTAGAAYGTFESGNRYPNVLGVTANNTLLLGVFGRSMTSITEIGVSVMEVNDVLQNPTNMVEAKFPISTSEYSGYLEGWREFVLLESDWNFYVYGGIITYNNVPTLVLFQVTDYPNIVDPDPYGYHFIPRSGLRPTKLTLTVTPL